MNTFCTIYSMSMMTMILKIEMMVIAGKECENEKTTIIECFEAPIRELTSWIFDGEGLFTIKRICKKEIEEQLEDLKIEKKFTFLEFLDLFNKIRVSIESSLPSLDPFNSKLNVQDFSESEFISAFFPFPKISPVLEETRNYFRS